MDIKIWSVVNELQMGSISLTNRIQIILNNTDIWLNSKSFWYITQKCGVVYISLLHAMTYVFVGYNKTLLEDKHHLF